ncbi:hypothetical protein NL445_28785, partial [Klebsiella pneumoniae]|nr:hypothetical protein [Klebsiella pneumoniae]
LHPNIIFLYLIRVAVYDPKSREIRFDWKVANKQSLCISQYLCIRDMCHLKRHFYQPHAVDMVLAGGAGDEPGVPRPFLLLTGPL